MTDILQYEGYFASVHFSAEDEVFFGKIIGINDSVTFEGGTVKELKKAFHDWAKNRKKCIKEASTFASLRSYIARQPFIRLPGICR
jgi:predicted HicB family RNase H-like nuclease